MSEAQLGTGSGNTQTTRVRQNSHLLRITKALLTKVRHVSQIQACEKTGPPQVLFSPCPGDHETPSISEVLTFSASQPFLDAFGLKEGVEKVSQYQQGIFNGKMDTCMGVSS